MRFLVWVVALVMPLVAHAADDPFAFTPPPDKGFVETPFGPAPAIRDWRKDTPKALVDGIAAYDAEDYEAAKRWLVPLADKGHAVALNIIGLMRSGEFVHDENQINACDSYEESSLLGYDPGQFNLGTCFLDASGRPENSDQSIKWLYALASSDDKIAQIKIAIAYKNKGDIEESFQWFEKAATNGSKFAEFALYVHGHDELVPNFTVIDWVCNMYAGYVGEPYDYCDD